MKNSLVSRLARWTVRGTLLLALLLGLAFTATARAETGSSTITLYAPSAPAGAWVSVQWQDRAGTWHDVAGWQSAIDMTEDGKVAFKQWGVTSADYGRGPFRWVVYAHQGGAVWGSSPNFYLPDGDGAALTMTLTPKSAAAATAATPAGFGFSTITMQAPGAPAGAWVGVQWRDLVGSWHDVEGWQSALDMSGSTSVPFKQWAVFPKDYGRGPFRWIIYAERGGAILATSQKFYLPDGNGAGLTMTLLSKIAVAPADTLAAEMGAEPPTLKAQTSTAGMQCGGGPCDFSVISVSVPDAPAGSKVGVQWQDGLGVWHDVLSWQGSLDLSDARGVPSMQWTVASDLQGKGPFRWVIYDQLGDAIRGVSPAFMLPEQGGVDLSLSLSS